MLRSNSPPTSLRTWLLPFALVAAAAGCGPDYEPLEVDPGLGTDEAAGQHNPQFDEVISPITCAARLDRYPVAAPYNNGYDANWNVFRCNGQYANSDYYRGGTASHPTGHFGNDVFARRGAAIVAARAGRVVFRANDSVGGLNVGVLDGCGWTTYYAHLDGIDGSIVKGARVEVGDRIGWMGDTGSAKGTAVHLHFSVFPDGNYSRGVDPFPLLKSHLETACTDPSDRCLYGDGLYCGDNGGVPGDPNKLYRCSGGQITLVRTCANGCDKAAPGVDDRCK